MPLATSFQGEVRVLERAAGAVRQGVRDLCGTRVRISGEGGGGCKTGPLRPERLDLLGQFLLDAVLRAEVHDSGPGTPRVGEEAGAGEDEGGRGLLLVSALADKWGVGERLPGKLVWCEFVLP